MLAKHFRSMVVLSLLLVVASPATGWALPPHYWHAPHPVSAYNVQAYQYQYGMQLAAYQNAQQIAAYRNAIYWAAYQNALAHQPPPSVNLYGLPPGLYSLAYRKAAAQYGANISWAQWVATSQVMELNRLFGGGSSGGDGPAASGD